MIIRTLRRKIQRIRLVDNWRTWHKRWSVWLGTLGATSVAVLVALPDVAMSAWRVMPDELRIAIPSRYMPLMGVGLFIASMLAQLIKQKKLDQPAAPTIEAQNNTGGNAVISPGEVRP